MTALVIYYTFTVVLPKLLKSIFVAIQLMRLCSAEKDHKRYTYV